jgi:hypothetical protein
MQPEGDIMWLLQLISTLFQLQAAEPRFDAHICLPADARACGFVVEEWEKAQRGLFVVVTPRTPIDLVTVDDQELPARPDGTFAGFVPAGPLAIVGTDLDGRTAELDLDLL